MNNEYEVVNYKQVNGVNLFIVDLCYRNLHMHKEYELCLLLDGPLEVYTYNNLTLHHKGDILLFNPNQPHELRAVKNGSARILSLQLSPHFFTSYYQQIENLAFETSNITKYCSSAQSEDVRNRLLLLSETYFSRPAYYEFYCVSGIVQLFLSLLLFVPSRIMSETERKHKRTMNKRLSGMLSYVDTHYTEKILLSDIARRENLSLSYLSHYFKAYLGLSFQKYIELLRFREACRLVEQTDLNMTDISITCGFSDSRYMGRIFREQFGCSPKEYRLKRHNAPRSYLERQSATVQRVLTQADSLPIIKKLIARMV